MDENNFVKQVTVACNFIYKNSYEVLKQKQNSIYFEFIINNCLNDLLLAYENLTDSLQKYVKNSITEKLNELN